MLNSSDKRINFSVNVSTNADKSLTSLDNLEKKVIEVADAIPLLGAAFKVFSWIPTKIDKKLEALEGQHTAIKETLLEELNILNQTFIKQQSIFNDQTKTDKEKKEAAKKLTETLKEKYGVEARLMRSNLDTHIHAAATIHQLDEKILSDLVLKHKQREKDIEQTKEYRKEIQKSYPLGLALSAASDAKNDAEIQRITKEIQEHNKYLMEKYPKEIRHLGVNLDTYEKLAKQTRSDVLNYIIELTNFDFEAQKSVAGFEKELNEIASEASKQTQENANKSKQRIENQKQALKDYEQNLSELLSLTKTDTEKQIEEVEAGYTAMMERLAEIQLPARLSGQSPQDYENSDAYKKYEDLMMNRAAIELQLEQEKEEQIAQIRANALEQRMQDMDTAIQKEYAGDIARFTDNEREKNRVEISMQNQRIDGKQALLQQHYDEEKALLDQRLAEGKLTEEEHAQALADAKKEMEETLYADRAQLRALELQQIQLNANAELLAVQGNAAEIFRIKQEQLNKELELYADNADKKAEIQARLNELLQEWEDEKAEKEEEDWEQKMGKLQEWVDTTMEVMGGLNEIMSNLEDGQLQKYEADNEKKKASLKNRLDNGLISQKEYDNKVAQMDKDLDKKKADTARKQAIRQKTMAIFDATVKMGTAILSAMNTQPFMPLGLAMAATAGVMGGIQIASIASQPIPKARRGMYIKGRRHEQGGVMIEAEDGEMIINSRSAQAYAPLLSAINEAGGGVPFVRPMSDGGYSSRTITQQGITPAEIETAMTAAVNKLQVYVAMNELREADHNYTQTIEQRSY